MGHNKKNGSHSEKWVTLGNMGHKLKNRLTFEKWITLKKKMGRTWKYGPLVKK